MKVKAILLALLLSPILAVATPSDSSLQQLSEVMPYEALFFDSIVTPIEQERITLIYALENDSKLTDDQRKKAVQAFDSYAQNLVKQFDTKAQKDKLKKSYLQSAKANFTQDEVNAQLAFYGSQHGKSALEKTQKVYEDFMQSVGQDTQKTFENYQKNQGIKMQDEVKRILNK